MNSLPSIALITLLLALLAGCGEPPYSNIDNAELQTLIAQGVPVYDIRRPDEWRQTGVIQGSQRLTFVDGRGQLLADFLPTLTQAIGKEQPLILVCQTGNRSGSLATYLANELGYSRVYNLRNGISGWLGERNPVAR